MKLIKKRNLRNLMRVSVWWVLNPGLLFAMKQCSFWIKLTTCYSASNQELYRKIYYVKMCIYLPIRNVVEYKANHFFKTSLFQASGIISLANIFDLAFCDMYSLACIMFLMLLIYNYLSFVVDVYLFHYSNCIFFFFFVKVKNSQE